MAQRAHEPALQRNLARRRDQGAHDEYSETIGPRLADWKRSK